MVCLIPRKLVTELGSSLAVDKYSTRATSIKVRDSEFVVDQITISLNMVADCKTASLGRLVDCWTT
jgi:hypothetical protein